MTNPPEIPVLADCHEADRAQARAPDVVQGRVGVRELAEEVLRLDARHVVLCDLMERRQGGREAHSEIMTIDGRLRTLAVSLATEIKRAEEGG